MKILFLLSCLLFSLTSCATPKYPVSDHFDGEKFYNKGNFGKKTFWTVLKWHLTTENAEWPKNLENKGIPQLVERAASGEGRITFINHSTFLIQVDGWNILTDPIYSERCSPVAFAGPKRVRRPGVEFDKLPPIDVVIISHNHYEHMDKETIRKLSEKFNPLFIVPLNNAHLVADFGAKKIQELDWWQTHIVGPGLKVDLVRVQHWSARGFFDRFNALWGGFWLDISGREKIFFAGDTGYGDHFKEIHSRYGRPTMSLLPIGAYEPRWFMKENHINPEEAVQAHLDLQSHLSFGMHFGTFQLTSEPWDEPLKALTKAREKLKVGAEQFRVLEFGETYILGVKK